MLCLRRLCHDFPEDNCRLKVPKNFVGEPLCVPQNFWSPKKIWIRGREGGREGGKEEGMEGGREGLSQFLSRN